MAPYKPGAHVLREKKYKNICPTWFFLLKGSGRSCPTHPYNFYFFLKSLCIFFHVKRVQNRNVLNSTCCLQLLLRVDPATSGSFSVVLTHIAQGDRKFVVTDCPNQFSPPHTLGTRVRGQHTRIWALVGRYWAHRSAPRRAIGALCSHDGRKDATMIFRSNFTYHASRWQ